MEYNYVLLGFPYLTKIIFHFSFTEFVLYHKTPVTQIIPPQITLSTIVSAVHPIIEITH